MEMIDKMERTKEECPPKKLEIINLPRPPKRVFLEVLGKS